MSVFNFKRVCFVSSCMWRRRMSVLISACLFSIFTCGGWMSVFNFKRVIFPSSRVWRTDVLF